MMWRWEDEMTENVSEVLMSDQTILVNHDIADK